MKKIKKNIKKSITIPVIIQRVDNKAFIKPCSSGFWRLELGLML